MGATTGSSWPNGVGDDELGAGVVSEDAAPTRSGRSWSWAALMRRAFDLDVLACPRCGSRMRLIATVHDPRIIRRILAHLGLACSGQSPGLAPLESSAAPEARWHEGVGSLRAALPARWRDAASGVGPSAP